MLTEFSQPLFRSVAGCKCSPLNLFCEGCKTYCCASLTLGDAQYVFLRRYEMFSIKLYFILCSIWGIIIGFDLCNYMNNKSDIKHLIYDIGVMALCIVFGILTVNYVLGG